MRPLGKKEYDLRFEEKKYKAAAAPYGRRRGNLVFRGKEAVGNSSDGGEVFFFRVSEARQGSSWSRTGRPSKRPVGKTTHPSWRRKESYAESSGREKKHWNQKGEVYPTSGYHDAGSEKCGLGGESGLV